MYSARCKTQCFVTMSTGKMIYSSSRKCPRIINSKIPNPISQTLTCVNQTDMSTMAEYTQTQTWLSEDVNQKLDWYTTPLLLTKLYFNFPAKLLNTCQQHVINIIHINTQDMKDIMVQKKTKLEVVTFEKKWWFVRWVLLFRFHFSCISMSGGLNS